MALPKVHEDIWLHLFILYTNSYIIDSLSAQRPPCQAPKWSFTSRDCSTDCNLTVKHHVPGPGSYELSSSENAAKKLTQQGRVKGLKLPRGWVYKCCIMLLESCTSHGSRHVHLYKMLSELTKFEPGNYARLPTVHTGASVDQFWSFPKSKAMPGVVGSAVLVLRKKKIKNTSLFHKQQPARYVQFSRTCQPVILIANQLFR